eukprot:CAMPEP_0169182266 /NCGR_PEP_ID=MMETSP1015-20121227/69125_1 /TAXON_ID=342587 /ORGANISM="Karlodinium micrum, Strain CCMP2283" /LENGTH=73 /DNA_ID=CAMNT_0009257455 /DNA_START=287 /DNA_END=508 /DNA_ORIENTATION=-
MFASGLAPNIASLALANNGLAPSDASLALAISLPVSRPFVIEVDRSAGGMRIDIGRGSGLLLIDPSRDGCLGS